MLDMWTRYFNSDLYKITYFIIILKHLFNGSNFYQLVWKSLMPYSEQYIRLSVCFPSFNICFTFTLITASFWLRRISQASSEPSILVVKNTEDLVGLHAPSVSWAWWLLHNQQKSTISHVILKHIFLLFSYGFLACEHVYKCVEGGTWGRGIRSIKSK